MFIVLFIIIIRRVFVRCCCLAGIKGNRERTTQSNFYLLISANSNILSSLLIYVYLLYTMLLCVRSAHVGNSFMIETIWPFVITPHKLAAEEFSVPETRIISFHNSQRSYFHGKNIETTKWQQKQQQPQWSPNKWRLRGVREQQTIRSYVVSTTTNINHHIIRQPTTQLLYFYVKLTPFSVGLHSDGNNRRLLYAHIYMISLYWRAATRR